MNIKDYYTILSEINEIDLDVSSIADSRRLMSELNEIEEALCNLQDNIKRDIKQIKSDHTKNKRIIIDKYSNKSQKSGITGILSSSPRKKMMKELKQLGMDKNKKLQEYHELEEVIKDFLLEVRKSKEPMNNFIKDRLSSG
ncbi:hypothetical protein DSECCO2_148050 [anaerobic digester metagenome]